MKLWTIQNYCAYQRMLDTGKLVANEEYVFDKIFLEPVYDWLFKQMSRRIGPPNEEIKYPIWAWYQRNGKRKKPDMRQTGYANKGEHIVRLTIEVPDTDVVLSDFDLYHYPLNYWYLPSNEEDEILAEKEYPEIGFNQNIKRELLKEPQKYPEFCEKMLNSWNRIFDFSLTDESLFYPMDKKTIQASMWSINLKNVENVEHFVGR